MTRLLSLLACVLLASALPVHAQDTAAADAKTPPGSNAGCDVGIYRGHGQHDIVVLTTPSSGEPGLRYMFFDGRRGALKDAASPVRCMQDIVQVLDKDGATTPWKKMPVRATPTRFDSGGIGMQGLLLEPEGVVKPPLAVFVHGSESTPSIGDATTSHYPYPYLLVAQGISMFVYDKRGTGASGGRYSQNFEDLAQDAVAASREARRLASGRYRRFGFWGGSQGGWIAPLAAQRANADYVVVGFGLVLSPLEEDAEQVYDELRRKGYDDKAIADAHIVTDATGDVIASHFTAGFDHLQDVKRRFSGTPWLSKIEGEFTGEILRTDEAELRKSGRDKFDNLDILWRYDAMAALRSVSTPQLWVMAADDTAAPGALSRERLTQLRREGKPIDVFVFPHTDHGIFEYTVDADGTRHNVRIADGYFRLLGDWIKRDLGPPYGISVQQP